MSKDTKFLLTMSDATGYGTGGTTDVLVTGASVGGVCNTQDPGVDFPFQLNLALQQCRPYVFSGYADAQQPVTIVATVPGGTSIILTPPFGPTSFSWDANVVHGTLMLFMMFDAQGRTGGCSDIKAVGITDDVTCLNGNSPSSTTTIATPTSTFTSSTGTSATTPTPSAAPSSGEPTKGTSIAAIAGTVIGALVYNTLDSLIWTYVFPIDH
ncbi:hypothetical protein BDZ94DRAFT_1257555 [Collybia nuda]|uniref:Uncharacterized protein n=1 Tax=Collybia nuda TaxID=64659 RepID=A0A9P5Y6Z0_9AGAR|nr:hypothetical protein BDZ94DRAFT_1257555 [Collybia nuda]